MALTKEPMRNSLAAKKKIAPKLKNVLAQPFPRYWPEITENDCHELEQCFVKAAQKSDKRNPHEIGVKLGTAACLRLLNRRDVSCVLLSSEIKPKYIAMQIIYSVISKRDGIDVLCVPNLKKITAEIFKVPTLMVAISRGGQSTIEDWIKVKSKSFPLPDKLVKYYTPRAIEEPPQECNSNGTARKNEMINFSQLYLPRKESGCRAFNPPNAKHIKPLVNEITEWPEYISFSDKTASSVVKMEVDESVQDNPKGKSLQKSKESVREVKKTKDTHNNSKEGAGSSASEVTSVPLLSTGIKFSEGYSQKKKQKTKKKKKKFTAQPGAGIFNYISLKVNKIQGNPNKKRKNKSKRK